MAALPLAAALLAAGCTPEQDLVIEGDVTVASEGDLERIGEATRITGALKVKRSAIDRLHLPRLVEIGGRLSVQKNERLTEVLLPALRSVGGPAGHEVLVERNFALIALDLRGLEAAAGGVVVRHNPRLERVDLGALSKVGRFGVELTADDGIRALELPALTSAPRLHVESCYRLERLGIAALEHVDSLTVRANSTLAEIDEIAPAGQRETAPAEAPRNDAAIEVRDNPKLPTCEGARLSERFAERGWSGVIAICGNLADTCAPVGCEPSSPPQ